MEIRGPLSVQKALSGAGIRILTQTISSPTLKDQMHAFLAMYPQAKWHVYEPVNRDNALEGAKLAFGEAVETQYRLENAAVIVSLDADFLYAGYPGNVRYIRDFAKRRNPDAEISRLYVVESTPSSTGAKADHRLPLRAVEVEHFARALASALGVNGGGATDSGDTAKFVSALAGDLQKHKGASLIIAGDHQPPAVHALAHAMNAALGNAGKTVVYTEPVDANPVNQTESLRDLVSDMRTGKVDLLVIMGGNPVYDAPADLGFGDCLKSSKVELRIYHGPYQNETAEHCHWTVNETHYLEAWSDGRAYDGTASLVQPLIAPLYGGKSAHEMLSVLSGVADASGYDIVRGYWQKQQAGAEFEAWWRKTLNDGYVEGSAYTPKTVALKLQRFRLRRLPPTRTVSRSIAPRSFCLRWPIRQQRMAAGVAEAHVETDLGQRGHDRAQDGRARRHQDHGRGHARIGRTEGYRACLDSSWPSGSFCDRAPWLWAAQSGTRRDGRRI
jgi:hypothetical protein